MRQYLTKTTFTDAGELRQFITVNYGGTLTFGGDPKTYFRALRLVKVLAKMIAAEFEVVLDCIKEDYEVNF